MSPQLWSKQSLDHVGQRQNGDGSVRLGLRRMCRNETCLSVNYRKVWLLKISQSFSLTAKYFHLSPGNGFMRHLGAFVSLVRGPKIISVN